MLWRAQFLTVQGDPTDKAVRLGYLMRGWNREFARDEHFAKFTMRNGALHHRADSASNRDAISFFGSAAEIVVIPLAKSESLDFIFQRRLEEVSVRL